MNSKAGDIETALAAIWKELLGVEEVVRDDDFFKLGADSVMASVMMMQVEETFGVYLDPAEIFERPILHEFAESIAGAQPASGESGEVTEGAL